MKTVNWADFQFEILRFERSSIKISLFIIVLFFQCFIWQSKSFRASCFTFRAKTEKGEKKEEENYLSVMRYLNTLRLKQDSPIIERKETGKSLYDFNGCINLAVITWIKFKNILPWISIINTHEQITHKIGNRIIKYLIPIYRV